MGAEVRRRTARRRTMRAGRAAAVGLIAGLGLLAGCTSPPPPSPEELAREMFDLANEERVDAGLEPLAWNDCLARKAAIRVEPFIEDAELVHAPLVASCHEGVRAGENLSRTDLPAADVVDLWMGSAGHRANILDPEFISGAIVCVEAAAPPSGAPSGVRACAHLFEG